MAVIALGWGFSRGGMPQPYPLERFWYFFRKKYKELKIMQGGFKRHPPYNPGLAGVFFAQKI